MLELLESEVLICTSLHIINNCPPISSIHNQYKGWAIRDYHGCQSSLKISRVISPLLIRVCSSHWGEYSYKCRFKFSDDCCPHHTSWHEWRRTPTCCPHPHNSTYQVDHHDVHHCHFYATCATQHKHPWALAYVYILWPRMGQWTSERPPWAHLLWTGGELEGISSANYFTAWLQLQRLEICPAWGTTGHIFLYVCSWTHYSAYRWTFPMKQWNNLQIFPSDAWNLLFRTILHSIHQPSRHIHPTIMKDLSQPQNVAIVWACSRHMFTSIVQPTITSKSKGFHVPELSSHL